MACYQQAQVLGMKAINILDRVNGIEHLMLVELLWQRQLYQDTVDVWILVQLPDASQDIRFCYVSREAMGDVVESHFIASLLLVPHVDRGSWIVTDQNDTRTRWLLRLLHFCLQIRQNRVAYLMSA